MIGIIDAKSGNIGSLENALEYLNIKYLTVQKKEHISSDMKLILPGVGSFHGLMKKLEQLDLIETIQTMISNNNPFFPLSICSQTPGRLVESMGIPQAIASFITFGVPSE